jgi:hypothetical protein
MDTPLNASATSAGSLLSGDTFEVPPYQREFAWDGDEIREFWEDLKGGLEAGSYFLGLVILTSEGPDASTESGRKHVVDGQQRIISLSLLVAAIYDEAKRAGRNALADRLQSDFLTSVNYQTDEVIPRVILSDERDNITFQRLTHAPAASSAAPTDETELARRLVAAATAFAKYLQEDLKRDPFKRLGMWADFLSKQVYLAVFVHPDPTSAYRVFEVINTRGRELTTADLLKNYVLSQTAASDRDRRYQEWKDIAQPLAPQTGPTSLVQFIRHVVTLTAGHILPRDLFAYLAGRQVANEDKKPPSVPQLMKVLERELPLYLQMIDPSLDGPAQPEWLSVFDALSSLNVITVRPLLLAIAKTGDPTEGMQQVLRLVVRRMVVGNLGTGNVERRFSEAALSVARSSEWTAPLDGLKDLNPDKDEFVEQLRKRSLNKATLTFVQRSILEQTPTPTDSGHLHLIRPRQAADWEGFPQDDFTYWGSTLGNTILADPERRPNGSATWVGVKQHLLPEALGDSSATLDAVPVWDREFVERRGRRLAQQGADVWYG